jgi:signal transduction histidine kinase
LDYKEAFFTSFQEIVENRKDSISAKFQIVQQDGNLSWVEIHLTTMRGENQSIVGVLSDITERIRIDALRDEFISTVSHEIRTPMCAIQEGLHLMQNSQSGKLNEMQRQILDITIRNIDRLSELINNVLDYQKYQSETKHITLYYENLHNTIQEAIVLMEPIAKQKGLSIYSILDYSIPSVMFNKDSILQVCINLINNAIKFTEKGSITIRTVKFDHEVCICVEDTGIGIPQESISGLFESFTQLNEKHSSKMKGTGLGLSICKKIIMRHNGKIWVESTFGQGSSFCFTIPLVNCNVD